MNIFVISGCDSIGDLFKTIGEQEQSDKDKDTGKDAEEKQQQKPEGKWLISIKTAPNLRSCFFVLEFISFILIFLISVYCHVTWIKAIVVIVIIHIVLI